MGPEIDYDKVDRWGKSDGTIRVGSDGQPLFGDEKDPADIQAELESVKAERDELKDNFDTLIGHANFVCTDCTDVIDALRNTVARLEVEIKSLKCKPEPLRPLMPTEKQQRKLQNTNLRFQDGQEQRGNAKRGIEDGS